MTGTITGKILRAHLVEGELEAGSQIGLRVDQTLTQDATGTMAYLQFEAVGVDRVATELSVSYIDHNTLQTGFENADDHLYLAGVARKYGIVLSRAGNGICHQVHLERFAAPAKVLVGSDSHTPTAGAGRASCLGGRQGCHSGTPAPADGERRGGLGHGVRRTRRLVFERAPASHYHQHGRRTGGDLIGLPE